MTDEEIENKYVISLETKNYQEARKHNQERYEIKFNEYLEAIKNKDEFARIRALISLDILISNGQDIIELQHRRARK